MLTYFLVNEDTSHRQKRISATSSDFNGNSHLRQLGLKHESLMKDDSSVKDDSLVRDNSKVKKDDKFQQYRPAENTSCREEDIHSFVKENVLERRSILSGQGSAGEECFSIESVL